MGQRPERAEISKQNYRLYEVVYFEIFLDRQNLQ